MREARDIGRNTARGALVFGCALVVATAAACLSPARAEARVANLTVRVPLVQAGDTTAFRARSGVSAGSSGSTMRAFSAKSLDKATRSKVEKKLVQAVKSMKTVQSARLVNVSSLKIRSSKKNDKAIPRVLANYVNFHPECFYVGRDLVLSKDSKGFYKTIELSYAYKFDSLKKKLAKCEKGLQDLLSWVPADAADSLKAKAAHDWLVRNCTYDANAEYEKDRCSPYNVYGALVNHKPVCQGYSLAFMLAMNEVGIEATCVGQYIGNQGHMWNRVKIDGNWYHVDLTFDDPLTNVTLPSYRDRGFYATPDTTYFMKSDAWWKGNAAKEGWHKSWFPQGAAGTDTLYDSVSSWRTYYKKAASPSKPTKPIVDLDEVATGTKVTLGEGASRAVFKVTGPGAASYYRCKVSDSAKKATVPSSVKVNGGKFRITGIAEGAFGSRPSVRTVTVKTKRLSERGVSGCFSASKVKAAKVPSSCKGAYRQYFAKKNSGRSVKVSAYR